MYFPISLSPHRKKTTTNISALITVKKEEGCKHSTPLEAFSYSFINVSHKNILSQGTRYLQRLCQHKRDSDHEEGI